MTKCKSCPCTLWEPMADFQNLCQCGHGKDSHVEYKNKYQQPTREQMWYSNEQPYFTCERCGEKFEAVNPGFVDRNGLPVHVKCSEPAR